MGRPGASRTVLQTGGPEIASRRTTPPNSETSVILGTTLLAVLVGLVGNLGQDIAQMLLDPGIDDD